MVENDIIYCDRCGLDCRISADDPVDHTPTADDNSLEAHVILNGAYGSARYDMDLMKAELCERCFEGVRAFIDAGPARGMTRLPLWEMTATFCNEEGILDRQLTDEQRDRFHAWLREKYGIVPFY